MSVKVIEKDDGIRPAGPKDACLYCGSKVGEDHKKDCVVPTKRVRVKIETEIEVEVPWGWDEGMVNFRYNESSWCADNLPSLIKDHAEYNEELDRDCLCETTKVKFLRLVDEEPIIIGNGENRFPKD